MPAASAAGFVFADRHQRHAEARAFDQAGQHHRADHQGQREPDVDAMILELHVGEGMLALHRQRQFLVTQPLEHVEQRKRIGQHGEREIMAAQAERRHADDQARESADDGGTGNADPGRQAPVNLRQRDEIGAQAEERGMAEGHEAAVSAQQVPREAHHRPHRHDREDQQIVGMPDECREQAVRDGESRDQQCLAAPAIAVNRAGHVRSASSPCRTALAVAAAR